jgi:lipopolysaccharide transport protein LptA
VHVVADRAVFHQPSRTATFLGSVKVTRDGEQIRCGRMVLLLSEQGHALESALAEEQVEVVRKVGRASGGKLAYRYETDEGLLSRQPRVVLPEGELVAELIHFRRDGSLVGERRVRLHHVPKPTQDAAAAAPALDLRQGAPVDIAAGRLDYAPQAGHVTFTGRVRVVREGVQLDAATVTLPTDAEGQFSGLLAEGAVQLRTGNRLATGDRLEYDFEGKQAYLQGSPAIARTGEDRVEALAMTFAGSGEEYSAREKVSIQMYGNDREHGEGRSGEPQPVLVTCGRAHFGANGSRVELAEAVDLTKSDEGLRLQSEELDLYLLANRRLSQMEARGGVRIEHANGKARGDLARYWAERRELEIEGNPAELEQPEGRSFPRRAVLQLEARNVRMDGERVRTELKIEPEVP